MNELSPTAAQRQIVETVVRLAQPGFTGRFVVCGDDALCAALQAEGLWASSFESCATESGPCLVGIVAGARSRTELAAAIAHIAPHLVGAAATLMVLIESGCRGLGPQAGPLLAPLGFRIDAGVHCQRGLLLSAHRSAEAAMAAAA